MKNLIYINACMRAGSRTLRIATPIIEELSKKYSVETVDLTKSQYPVADNHTLEDRNQGIVPPEHVVLAKKIAAADRIVIAAPFWDMSFPSALKVFFENMSLFGVTFDSNDKECYGLCKAEKVMYITTRGMDISTGDPLEQATPYIKALSHLWGWGELTVISAQNMDYSTPEEIVSRVSKAIEEGLEICKEF
ncbi:MAG: NAD(P)H-dependent oxidoreductase [Bacteroidales bacterium]|nr:NAD(P)H-dependent oxidoreductase [Bacteroidales bacterium]